MKPDSILLRAIPPLLLTCPVWKTNASTTNQRSDQLSETVTQKPGARHYGNRSHGTLPGLSGFDPEFQTIASRSLSLLPQVRILLVTTRIVLLSATHSGQLFRSCCPYRDSKSRRGVTAHGGPRKRRQQPPKLHAPRTSASICMRNCPPETRRTSSDRENKWFHATAQHTAHTELLPGSFPGFHFLNFSKDLLRFGKVNLLKELLSRPLQWQNFHFLI
jgi:hypothetical protein